MTVHWWPQRASIHSAEYGISAQVWCPSALAQLLCKNPALFPAVCNTRTFLCKNLGTFLALCYTYSKLFLKRDWPAACWC